MDENNLTPEEQRLLKIVNLGIQQVVVPALDDLEESINKKFDTVDKRFDDLTDKMNSRFDNLERKADRISATVAKHDTQIAAL